MPRDDQIGDFQPDTALFQPFETVEHRGQLCLADRRIEILTEALEVDIGRVKVPAETGKGLGIDKAVGVINCQEPGPPGSFGAVEHEFVKGRRLGVGEGDAPTPLALCHERKLGRESEPVGRLERRYLGDLPVLAEFAAQVAPGTGEGEGAGFGVEVEKRFFLHRVHVHGAGEVIAERAEPAGKIFPRPAKAGRTVPDRAASGAELATHRCLAVVKLLIPERLPALRGIEGDLQRLRLDGQGGETDRLYERAPVNHGKLFYIFFAEFAARADSPA